MTVKIGKGMGGLDVLGVGAVRPSTVTESRAAGEWLEARVLEAMPGASRAEQVAVLGELVDCVGIRGVLTEADSGERSAG